MYGTSSPPMRLPRPHDPLPYASPIDMSKQSRGDHRGTTPHRSDTSYEEDETYSPHRHMPHSNQFRDVVGPDKVYQIPDTIQPVLVLLIEEIYLTNQSKRNFIIDCEIL